MKNSFDKSYDKSAYRTSCFTFYQKKGEDKIEALNKCIGFSDVTVLEIDRPENNSIQNHFHNGYKRKQALKI